MNLPHTQQPLPSPFINLVCTSHFTYELTRSKQDSSRIRSIVGAGLIDKWKYQYWPRDDECNWKGDGSSEDQTLYVADFAGYFLLLVVGNTFLDVSTPAMLITSQSHSSHLSYSACTITRNFTCRNRNFHASVDV